MRTARAFALTALTLAGCRTAPVAGTRTVRVAVCQTLCIDGDVEGNLRRIEHAAAAAAAARAELACFPETTVIGWVNPQAHEVATSIPGTLSDRIAELARRHGLMLALGLHEREGGALYDAAVLVDRDGSILHKHRKVNTIQGLLDPPYTRGEPDAIAAVDTRLGRIGLLICADTFQQRCVERIAAQRPDLVLVPYGWAAAPAAWPGHGESMAGWVTAVARAARCPVVGTDGVGAISQGPWQGMVYGGQSVVVDAAGRRLGVLRDRDVDLRVFDIELPRR